MDYHCRMKTVDKEKLAEILGLESVGKLEIDDETIEELIYTTYLVQRKNDVDGVYYRIVNKDGEAIVIFKGYLVDFVIPVSHEVVEQELNINFGADFIELVIPTAETLH